MDLDQKIDIDVERKIKKRSIFPESGSEGFYFSGLGGLGVGTEHEIGGESGIMDIDGEIIHFGLILGVVEGGPGGGPGRSWAGALGGPGGPKSIKHRLKSEKRTKSSYSRSG